MFPDEQSRCNAQLLYSYVKIRLPDGKGEILEGRLDGTNGPLWRTSIVQTIADGYATTASGKVYQLMNARDSDGDNLSTASHFVTEVIDDHQSSMRCLTPGPSIAHSMLSNRGLTSTPAVTPICINGSLSTRTPGGQYGIRNLYSNNSTIFKTPRPASTKKSPNVSRTETSHRVAPYQSSHEHRRLGLFSEIRNRRAIYLDKIQEATEARRSLAEAEFLAELDGTREACSSDTESDSVVDNYAEENLTSTSRQINKNRPREDHVKENLRYFMENSRVCHNAELGEQESSASPRQRVHQSPDARNRSQHDEAPQRGAVNLLAAEHIKSSTPHRNLSSHLGPRNYASENHKVVSLADVRSPERAILLGQKSLETDILTSDVMSVSSRHTGRRNFKRSADLPKQSIHSHSAIVPAVEDDALLSLVQSTRSLKRARSLANGENQSKSAYREASMLSQPIEDGRLDKNTHQSRTRTSSGGHPIQQPPPAAPDRASQRNETSHEFEAAMKNQAQDSPGRRRRSHSLSNLFLQKNNTAQVLEHRSLAEEVSDSDSDPDYQPETKRKKVGRRNKDFPINESRGLRTSALPSTVAEQTSDHNSHVYEIKGASKSRGQITTQRRLRTHPYVDNRDGAEANCHLQGSGNNSQRGGPSDTDPRFEPKSRDPNRSQHLFPEGSESDQWHPDEIEMLHKAIALTKTEDIPRQLYWQHIASIVGSKSEAQCRRWHRLEKKNAKTAQAQLKHRYAGKGTLKRKEQMRELVDQANKGYSPDVFGDTPAKKHKYRLPDMNFTPVQLPGSFPGRGPSQAAREQTAVAQASSLSEIDRKRYDKYARTFHMGNQQKLGSKKERSLPIKKNMEQMEQLLKSAQRQLSDDAMTEAEDPDEEDYFE